MCTLCCGKEQTFSFCFERVKRCALLDGRNLCMPGMERVSVYWAGFARVYIFFWHETGNSYSHTPVVTEGATDLLRGS